MKKLKKKFSNKIIIYQMTLLDRILGMGSVLFFVGLPVVSLILGLEYKFEIAVFLLIMIVYSIFMYFNVFKTYICLDIKNSKLIIRETPGLKSEEISLDSILDIKIFDGVYTKEFFTININMQGYTKKIESWSVPPSSRIAMFGRYKRQTKRLKKFCDECNRYLNTKTFSD
jgi:hypothetical protein